MNGLIKDSILQAIQKVLDFHCEDEKRWPKFFTHDTLAQDMTNAAEVVFDACVASSQFTEKETR